MSPKVVIDWAIVVSGTQEQLDELQEYLKAKQIAFEAIDARF